MRRRVVHVYAAAERALQVVRDTLDAIEKGASGHCLGYTQTRDGAVWVHHRLAVAVVVHEDAA